MVRNVSVGPDWSEPWPSPVADRSWVSDDGTEWRMRGGPIGEREVRRLLRRPDVRVLHVYGTEPVELPAKEASEVLDALQVFYDGRAQPFADFVVADFRSNDHDVLIVIEESC
ncbi:hypothetical protein [Phycicoccus jejuensis]|uniref:hypothetical protein n=1 Tax=Phycicoccus jejuensis TaxID=367299 RepID=UPI0004C35DE5|nr:hypothetical protein [Phycicoccus jejuensis]